MFVRWKALGLATVHEKIVRKKEAGVTDMIILMLICPKIVHYKNLLFQISIVNVYKGSEIYAV
jgi:hypothetical protein